MFSNKKYKANAYVVGFEVIMALSTKMAVFWVVAPCRLFIVIIRATHRPADGGSQPR
jgi:hypothetical protein